MNLPGLFSSTPAQTTHIFFVIYFAEGSVRAALWQVIENRLEIISISNQQLWQSDAELIDAADAALQELGTESENVRQTLFALEPTWVNQQGILAEKKQLFHQLTKELDLEAVGFVVIPEAIVQHALHSHGAEFECFVIEVLSERVSMTQVKDGKLGQQEMVARSTNLVEDISQGFGRFQSQPLPSTLLMYSAVLSTEELQECSRRLLELDLTVQYSFAEALNIETFDTETFLDVIVQTGGRAVAESRQLIAPEHFVETPIGASLSDNLETEIAPLDEASQELQSAEHFLPSAHSMAETFHDTDHYGPRDTTLLFGKFHLPHHPVLFATIGLLLGAALLAVMFFFASTRLVTATVNVELKTSALSKQLALRLDPQAVVSDPVAGVLKAELLKHVVSGTKEADTTGKKLIGDKAKGKVTIFNRTSSSKTFPAGTVLQSGSFKFLLDSATTVASASTGSNFETNPGTVEAAVTAAAIGAESNIAKDLEMVIDSFAKDTYIARSKEAFTGGTSREIKAVSQKDRDELLTALRKELSEQAAKELQGKVGQGQYVFPTNTTKTTSSTFSAEIGKETNTVELKLSVEAQALSYSASELQQLARQVMQQDVPPGYAFPQDGIEILTQPATTSTASAQVNINANLSTIARPTVQAGDWRQEIAGKTEAEAAQLLQQKPEVASVTLRRQPTFFTKFNSRLPKNLENITINIR